MARRRTLSLEQRKKEIDWLESHLRRTGIQKKDLADKLDIENPNNISHWVRLQKGSPIPDLDLLKLGKIFKDDVFALRPSLNEYAEFFGDASILEGLSETTKGKVVADIDYYRRLELSQPPTVMEFKKGPASRSAKPTKRKG